MFSLWGNAPALELHLFALCDRQRCAVYASRYVTDSAVLCMLRAELSSD